MEIGLLFYSILLFVSSRPKTMLMLLRQRRDVSSSFIESPGERQAKAPCRETRVHQELLQLLNRLLDLLKMVKSKAFFSYL
jgi:hypothetical protein